MPSGQGLKQFDELGLAFALSSLIGVERVAPEIGRAANPRAGRDRVDTRHPDRELDGRAAVAVTLEVQGQPTVQQLTLDLNDLDGVLEVTTLDLAETGD